MPELPKTRLSGATKWLTKDKALLMLSLRHKSNDHFWFSFFHEGGHILYDSKKKVFLDSETTGTGEREEEERANRFASNLLIPEEESLHFVSRGQFDNSTIRDFAHHLGIAPGIVVGRLQHEKLIEFKRGNTLKEKFVLTFKQETG